MAAAKRLRFGILGGSFRRCGEVVFLTCLLSITQYVSASQTDNNIMGMSLEELMNIEIVSASKNSQRLFETAASVYVLTGEEIERSGVMTVPDALRLIPGVEVARADANRYTVSMRGFTSVLANKLLVLINGRPVYDPLFAGVFWESREVALETIDHIEVVRGPGGAIWGANAVNGVINIITKDAFETEKVKVSGAAGSRPRGYGYAHVGQKNSNRAFRLSVNLRDDDHGYAATDAYDTRESLSTNFRIENPKSARNHITFLAGYFDVNAGQGTTPETNYNVDHVGGNASLFYSRDLQSGDKLSAQLVTDYFKLDHLSLNEERHLAQAEVRHEWHPLARHEVLWGVSGEYRRDFVDVKSSLYYLDPSSSTQGLFSVFAQDHVKLVGSALFTNFGAKLEHNEYTGFEFQPNASLGWHAHRRNFVWGSVSRAVRTPSRLERDIATSGIRLGDTFNSETLIGYQIGDRLNVSNDIALDVTAFYHDYDNLISGELDGYHNDMYGDSRGIEAESRWQVARFLQLQAGYSYVRMNIDVKEGSHPTNIRNAQILEIYDPRNMVTFRSLVEIGYNVNVDGTIRYVDHTIGGTVPSYLVGDVSVGWRPANAVTLTLAARDLFNPHHYEQAPGATITQVEPTFYVRMAFVVE